jgi:peptidylprolyl isomerase
MWRKQIMNVKRLVISLSIVVAIAGCSTQTSQEETTVPSADENTAVEQTVNTGSEDTPALSEADMAEILAGMEQTNALPEVVLDEAAMADFLELDLTTTDSGLQYAVTEKGDGEIPEAGQIVQVHYTGKLADGTVFDSSYEYGDPIAFPLGQGFVIPGWDEGISHLPVGSKAKLVIPPELAYGQFGSPGVIPPNATLYFDVELLDILPGSPDAPAEVAESNFVTTDSGLQYADLEEGTGASPATGEIVAIHYTGWLEDGTKFDSSLDRGMPFVFPVGEDYIIPGLDEGLSSMKVGGKRQLIVPAKLAYGEEGVGEVIPANANLIFEVELLEIQS